jgi:hypothetical protein
VGIICDYFAAPSDDDAAAVIDRVGGPSDASGPPPLPAKRSFFRLRPRQADGPSIAGDPAVVYPTVAADGIDPVVQMGTLEAALTRRPYDDVMDARENSGLVALRDGGERLVVRLSAGLTAALADSGESELAPVAVTWSRTEEFWGRGDPVALSGLLGELSDLAREARAKDWSLYCFVCV